MTSQLPSPQDNPSFYSSEYTSQYSKYSCSRSFYFIHITFNYLIVISGALCFLTRLAPPQYKRYHRKAGRMYIICMLWSTATSMLIHNTGLPLAVLWSFLWVLLFMCIAWLLIVKHIEIMDSLAFQKIAEDIEKGVPIIDFQQRFFKAKGEIAQAKTFKERFVSLKTAHGTLMFTSWLNIVGRIFASNQSGDFTCHTYPAYKSLDTPHGKFANQTSPTLVEFVNPDYATLPWAKTGVAGWAVALSIGPISGALLFGLIYSYKASKNSKNAKGTELDGSSGSH